MRGCLYVVADEDVDFFRLCGRVDEDLDPYGSYTIDWYLVALVVQELIHTEARRIAEANWPVEHHRA